MIVEFRDQDGAEIRRAGLTAVPRQFEAVKVGESEYMVEEICWNLSPNNGVTKSVDVTVWLESGE